MRTLCVICMHARMNTSVSAASFVHALFEAMKPSRASACWQLRSQGLIRSHTCNTFLRTTRCTTCIAISMHSGLAATTWGQSCSSEAWQPSLSHSFRLWPTCSSTCPRRSSPTAQHAKNNGFNDIHLCLCAHCKKGIADAVHTCVCAHNADKRTVHKCQAHAIPHSKCKYSLTYVRTASHLTPCSLMAASRSCF
jgi:hypothetical protein